MATEALPSSLSGYRPAPNEKQAMQHLFDKADTDQLGVLTGDKAVPFFQHSSLPPTLLGEIWQIADPENSGFLSPERFAIACRLIGHAQAQAQTSAVNPNELQVDDSWVRTPGPFPKFKGFPIPSHLLSTGSSPSTPSRSTTMTNPSSATAATASPQRSQTNATNPNAGRGAGQPGMRVTPEEKVRYATLFNNSGPINGLLDGDKARDIFIKSKLPFETLGQIWNLADTHSRGQLDVADFTIGMHLIQHTMNGSLAPLPTVLNPALYASAIAMPLPATSTNSNSNSTIMQTGSRLPQSPLRQSSFPPQQNQFSTSSPQQQQQAQNIAWEITPQEKMESDGYFDGIDAQRKGAIEGEAAVGFFLQSGLQMDVLARVWDLADIRQTGALNKDEFAVALKLIRDRVAGKELPTTLPLNLTPPSLRAPHLGASVGYQQQQQPLGPQRDLLDLMDDEPAPPATTAAAISQRAIPAIIPQGTGNSYQQQQQQQGQRSLSPQLTGQRTMSPQLTGQQNYALQGTIFPQATGVSQTLSPQTTGQPSASSSSQFSRSTPIAIAAAAAGGAGGTNFFDENDDADTRAHLSANETQLESLENEHRSLTKQVTNLNSNRSELESALTNTTSQINELHISLSKARAAHETERKLVDDLTKRNEEQKAVLARARHELIAAESDLSALRVERTEIEGQFLRDKEEVRAMKKKMADVANETNMFRETLDKLKKDARQQKGLVAISRKQLSSSEAEKEKIENELKEAERNVASGRSVEPEVEESPFDHHSSSGAPKAAAVALPLTPPAVVSPAGSNRSNNPFDRMGSISKAISPQPTGTSTTEPAVEKSSIASTGLGLPVAAAGAIGAGAVAAASAVAAGAAGLFGGGHKAEEKKEEDTSEPVPVSTPVPASAETDPFGVPIARDAELTASAAAAPASKSAFDAAFDDGFGDDFSSSAVPTSTAEAAAPSAAFDDEFDSSFPPTEPVAAVAESSTTAPVAESAEPGSVLPAAVASTAAATEPTPPRHEDDVFSSSSTAREIEPEQESESSDDEPEIEDAVATHHPRSAIEDESVQNTPTTDAGTHAPSTSDSGESYVHVPSGVQEDEAVQPVATTDEHSSTVPDDAATTIAQPTRSESLEAPTRNTESPTSELDTFEDARHGESEAPTETSAVPGAFPSATTPDTTSVPSTELPSVSAGSTPATQRRAAPPPPLRSNNSVSSASGLFASVPGSTPPVVTNANADFDDAFGDSFSSPSSKAGPAAIPRSTSATDDFDDAFNDLGPASTIVPTSSSSTALGASTSTTAKDFDFDDEAFDFKPDFPETSSKAATGGGGGSTDFDDSFSNFDSAFDQPKPISNNMTTSPSDFEEAFNPTPRTVSNPIVDEAMPGDSDEVRTITAMGFSRKQALTALDKFDGDVNRATNSLLGM